jgi:DNA-binding protein HU-beta
MNQKQMAELLAYECGCTVALAETLLIAQIELILGALRGADEVSLGRLCSFYVSEQQERTGRNPRTGEPVTIPYRKRIKCRINKRFQGRVQ